MDFDEPLDDLLDLPLEASHPATEDVDFAMEPTFLIVPSAQESGTVSEMNLPVVSGTLKYEQNEQKQRGERRDLSALPDAVRNFVGNLYRTVVTDPNVYETHSIYEHSYNRITERFFLKSRWPHPDLIAPLVDNDQILKILYKELYFRHIYSKLQPTIQERVDSFKNYQEFFELFIKGEDEICHNLELPGQLLWDIVDEYIYQFESFHRQLLKDKDLMATMKSQPKLWSVDDVISNLQGLIDKSNINLQLEANNQGVNPSSVSGELGRRNLYKMLGYFSIIGLLRVYCITGKFENALKSMNSIQLNKRGLFPRVTACHVSTYYYVGFAYLALTRYSDAIKIFSHILSFISRAKHFTRSTHQSDQIAKKFEQIYALLAICVALYPQRVDEEVHGNLRERYGEAMNRMHRGYKEQQKQETLAVFEELFSFACPKFINASSEASYAAETTKHQLKIFLENVSQRLHIPLIRSYLKLYSTISVDKLASFLEVDKKTMGDLLASYKQLSRQLKWTEGPLLSGQYGTTAQAIGGQSDLDFSIEKDVIHVKENKVGRRFGDYFVRNINKLTELIRSLDTTLPTQVTAAV